MNDIVSQFAKTALRVYNIEAMTAEQAGANKVAPDNQVEAGPASLALTDPDNFFQGMGSNLAEIDSTGGSPSAEAPIRQAVMITARTAQHLDRTYPGLVGKIDLQSKMESLFGAFAAARMTFTGEHVSTYDPAVPGMILDTVEAMSHFQSPQVSDGPHALAARDSLVNIYLARRFAELQGVPFDAEHDRPLIIAAAGLRTDVQAWVAGIAEAAESVGANPQAVTLTVLEALEDAQGLDGESIVGTEAAGTGEEGAPADGAEASKGAAGVTPPPPDADPAQTTIEQWKPFPAIRVEETEEGRVMRVAVPNAKLHLTTKDEDGDEGKYSLTPSTRQRAVAFAILARALRLQGSAVALSAKDMAQGSKVFVTPQTAPNLMSSLQNVRVVTKSHTGIGHHLLTDPDSLLTALLHEDADAAEDKATINVVSEEAKLAEITAQELQYNDHALGIRIEFDDTPPRATPRSPKGLGGKDPEDAPPPPGPKQGSPPPDEPVRDSKLVPPVDPNLIPPPDKLPPDPTEDEIDVETDTDPHPGDINGESDDNIDIDDDDNEDDSDAAAVERTDKEVAKHLAKMEAAERAARYDIDFSASRPTAYVSAPPPTRLSSPSGSTYNPPSPPKEYVPVDRAQTWEATGAAVTSVVNPRTKTTVLRDMLGNSVGRLLVSNASRVLLYQGPLPDSNKHVQSIRLAVFDLIGFGPQQVRDFFNPEHAYMQGVSKGTSWRAILYAREQQFAADGIKDPLIETIILKITELDKGSPLNSEEAAAALRGGLKPALATLKAS